MHAQKIQLEIVAKLFQVQLIIDKQYCRLLFQGGSYTNVSEMANKRPDY